jgi:hypothetical protein
LNKKLFWVINLFDNITKDGEGLLILVKVTLVAFNGTTILTQSPCLNVPRLALVNEIMNIETKRNKKKIFSLFSFIVIYVNK